MQELHERIALLPEPDRTLVTMQLEGYSYEEIAKALGMTVKNVSVKLVRIKDNIQNRNLTRYGNVQQRHRMQPACWRNTPSGTATANAGWGRPPYWWQWPLWPCPC